MNINRIVRALLMVTLSMALAVGMWGVLPAGKIAAATCTWTGTTDTSWTTATNWNGCGGGTPGASDTAIIPDVSAGSGNHPVVSATLTVGTITIQNGGILEYSAPSGVTFSITTFNIEDGGKYIHNRAASTPLNTATNRNFAANSIVEIRAWGTMGSTFPVFGHLIVNASGSVQMSGLLSTVNGNLTKQGSGELRFGTTQTISLSIGGNLDIQEGTVTIQSGTATTDATILIAGNVSIANGATLRSGANATGVHTIAVGGNWTNNGTFTPNANVLTTVFFNGAAEQTIGGSAVTAFRNLTVNSGATVVIPTTNTPTVAGTLTNNGTLKQTRTVNNATVNFLTISTDKYRGVDIETTNNLGSVTVAIQGNAAACTTNPASPAYVKRCFSITPTNNNLAARLTLWATDAEMNGIDYVFGDAALFRYVTNQWVEQTWVEQGTYTNNYNYITADVTGFSSFLMGESGETPTAVALSGLRAASPFVAVVLLAAAGLVVLRKRK